MKNVALGDGVANLFVELRQRPIDDVFGAVAAVLLIEVALLIITPGGFCRKWGNVISSPCTCTNLSTSCIVARPGYLL
jgi:hypothetical protein